MSEEKTIKVGDLVDIKDKRLLGGLCTYNMSGIVKMLHDKSGACVEIFVSRVFSPHFWYALDMLSIPEVRSDFVPVSAGDMEELLGGRGKRPLYNNKIVTGCFRSWFIARTRALAGQSVDRLIAALTWAEMYNLYMDSSDQLFRRWVEQYDTRPKRPRMVVAKDVGELDTVGIKRPKMV
jgi:hypothetical protein